MPDGYVPVESWHLFLARPSCQRETYPFTNSLPVLKDEKCKCRRACGPNTSSPQYCPQPRAHLSFSLDGTIQSWSRGAEQLYGYTAAEIIGRPLTTLLPICEIPACEEFLRASKDETFARCESTERLRKNGSRIGVALKRAAVQDETGTVTGIVEIGRAEGFHAQNPTVDAQLRLVLQQMPAVLWTADQDLKITSHWGAVHPRPKPGTWWA